MMGYRLDFEVEKEYIDTWLNGDIYSPVIKITGSSVTDTINLEQDGVNIGFTLGQFKEFIHTLQTKSIWSEL